MHGCWVWIKDVKRPYMRCTCGSISWDGKKCLKKHEFGYDYTPRGKSKRYSGDSKHQKDVGGHQQSGHS